MLVLSKKAPPPSTMAASRNLLSNVEYSADPGAGNPLSATPLAVIPACSSDWPAPRAAANAPTYSPNHVACGFTLFSIATAAKPAVYD